MNANAERWWRWGLSVLRPGRGIPLNVSGPSQPARLLARRVFAVLLGLAMTAVAVAQYRVVRAPVTVAWMAVGPLLASLVLRPRITAVLASSGDSGNVSSIGKGNWLNFYTIRINFIYIKYSCIPITAGCRFYKR